MSAPAISLTLTPEAAEALRASMRLSREEIDLIADVLIAKLRSTPSALTLKQMGAKYGRSYDYMLTQVKRGRLRAVRPGGVGDMMVLAEDELAWLRGEVMTHHPKRPTKSLDAEHTPLRKAHKQ